MRRFLVLVLCGLSSLCLAQETTGILGTKAGSGVAPVTSAAGGGVGAWALVQMLIALGIVAFLLKTILPKFAGKLNKKLVTKAEGGIQVEESAQFAGGSLYIVTARGKSLLLSVSSQGVTNLADLTKPAEPDPFAVALEAAEPFTPQQDARAALDRLERLVEGHVTA